MALIVRILYNTLIRIGNETSRDDKEKATYGLSTMQDEHIDFEPTEITDDHDKWYDSQVGGKFTFVVKSNKKHEIEINDEEIPDLPALVMMCKDAKKGKSDDLFLFFDEDGNSQDVKAYHVNEYIQDISGEKFTAKDFRTWGGTKLAAEEISEFRKKDDKKQRKKNITKMVKGVAKRLGNTPAVCRGSYIHPRFINDYLKGSFFRLWKDTLGEQMYPLSESESHVIRYLENIPNKNRDDLKLPDARIIRPRELIIHDNIKKKLYFIINVFCDEKINNYQIRYEQIINQIENLIFLSNYNLSLIHI